MKKTVLIFIMLLISCNQRGKDYQKEYDQRVMLAIILSTPDPSGNCVKSMQAAESCLTSAASPPAPVSETTLSLIFSSNASTTYTAYCNTLLSSAAFTTFSDRAKDCSMKCVTDFWNSRKSNNVCTETFSLQITALQDGTKACNQNCFKLLNNDPPQ